MKASKKSYKFLRNSFILFSLALFGVAGVSLLVNRTASATEEDIGDQTSNNFITDIYEGAIKLLPELLVEPELMPTPTQPIPIPTPTNYPLLVNPTTQETLEWTWRDYPGPTTWPSMPIPHPIGIIPVAEHQINIVLLGNDHRPQMGTRTDMIMLLSLNPSTGTASVISFPRDLFVYAPGLTMLKLNTIVARGGYDVFFDTFEYNFGIRPDYYVNISMDSFVEVVNKLGGIDVVVPYALSDPVYAKGKFSVRSGTIHMDGPMAKWYVISRSTSNDFNRNLRQQAVLKSIFLKLLSKDGLNKAPELFELYKNSVVTNMRIEDLLPLIPLAGALTDTSRVSLHSIGLNQVTVGRTPISRAYILIPNQLEILKVIIVAVNP